MLFLIRRVFLQSCLDTGSTRLWEIPDGAYTALRDK